jgi:hypothetical protein
MFRIRDWERYKFFIDVEHLQAKNLLLLDLEGQQLRMRLTPCAEQQKEVLSRNLPENLKLAIAKRIENNLFGKVILANFSIIFQQKPIYSLSGAMGVARFLF